MQADKYQEFCSLGILSATEKAGRALIFGLGLTGEAGEVADIIKKVYGHGKPLNEEHLKEELGDVMWYVANLCSEFGFKLEDVMDYNVNKLKKRYEGEYKDGSNNK